MSRYIKYLALCFASIFLITTAPLQAWGAGENSSLAATAGSTLAEAAETSATADSAETASPDEAAAFFYEHDPMENPKAAEDIMVNPDAVYGYSPRPDSVRLKAYADADWSDAALVESARQQRLDYHDSMSELYRIIEEMLGEAKNVEEIARAVSTRRNELRLESYKDNPEELEKVKKSKGFCIPHFGDLCEAADNKLNGNKKDEFYSTVTRLMRENFDRLQEDVSWLVEKFDYQNQDADWKNSKDAVQRGMQKLKGGYPADAPYRSSK